MYISWHNFSRVCSKSAQSTPYIVLKLRHNGKNMALAWMSNKPPESRGVNVFVRETKRRGQDNWLGATAQPMWTGLGYFHMPWEQTQISGPSRLPLVGCRNQDNTHCPVILEAEKEAYVDVIWSTFPSSLHLSSPTCASSLSVIFVPSLSEYLATKSPHSLQKGRRLPVPHCNPTICLTKQCVISTE